jgi:hypothetical protein
LFARKNYLIGRCKLKKEATKARKEAEKEYYGNYRKIAQETY